MTEREALFRAAAVQHRAQGKTSSLLFEDRLMAGVSWLAVLLLCSLVAILASLRYKEAVTVRGVLEPRGGTRQMLSPHAGTVQRLHVSAGERIEKGQVVATLSTASYDVDGKMLEALDLQAARSALALMVSELELQAIQHQGAMDQARQVMQSLEASIALIEDELRITDQQLTLSEAAVTGLQPLLASGNLARMDYDQRQMAYLELSRQRQQAAQRLQTAFRGHEAAAAERARLLVSDRQQRTRLERESLELRSRISRLERQATHSLVAMVSGTVAAIAFDEGDSVRAGQPVLYVLPADASLQAVLYVPSRAVGTLQPGQEVLLSYDGFDHAYYGRYAATIVQISRAALDPREHMLPVSGANEPLFRVLALPRQHYVEGADIYALQAGFALTAELIAADASLIAYIFKPLLSLRGRVS